MENNTLDTPYVFFKDLVKEVDIPRDGILSRTVHSDQHLKVIVFGFDKGQELSSHTSSSSAIIHILKGEAQLSFGGVTEVVGEGAWVRMHPKLEHGLYANTPVTMLLYMMD